MNNTIVGVVLCGGKSLRMGSDKNHLSISGQTFLQAIVSVLDEACDYIILVTSWSTRKLPKVQCRRPLTVLYDQNDNGGPLEAIRVALSWIQKQNRKGIEPSNHPIEIGPESLVFFTGNDTPGLVAGMVRYLADKVTTYDAVFPVDKQRCYPLCSIMRPHCIAAIDQMADIGDRRLQNLPSYLNVLEIQTDQLLMIDPKLQSLLNINQPADIKKLSGE